MKKTLLFFTVLIFSNTLIFSQPFAAVQNIDPNTGNEPYEIAYGDLDGDGDLDLVMATYDFNGGDPVQDHIKWYKNDGDGNFTIETTVSSTILWVDGLTVSDIDGQFGNDIIATSVSQNKLVYFLSNASGGFDMEVVIDGALNGPGEVIAGDINQDGHMDIATMSYTDNKTVWYSGDGTGNFASELDIENGTTDGPYYIELADLDADSDLDIVVGFVNSGTVEIYYNQFIESGSTMVSWVKDAVTLDSSNSFLFNITSGDVNNDGIINVVVVDNVDGDVKWFEKIKNGTSTENTVSTAASIARPASVTVVDIDSDGDNDVIVTDAGAGDDAVIYFEGNPNTSPNASYTTIADNNFQMFDIIVQDLDGDTDMDIAAVGNSADTVFWYKNELVSLSTVNNELEPINIFPNPAKNILNFRGLSSETLNLSVYDVVGKSIIETSIAQNGSLDISALKNGLYMIKFTNSTATYKFIKE